jgi:hypothetical protein
MNDEDETWARDNADTLAAAESGTKLHSYLGLVRDREMTKIFLLHSWALFDSLRYT